MLQAKEHAPTPSPSDVFIFELLVKSIKELGVRQNQPNAMEARFARLEALVMNMASNMATQMKPITHVPRDFLA